MSARYERIVLFKLRSAHAERGAREAFARELAATLGAAASVGLPADAAAEKSWDVSVVLRAETLEAALALDPLAAVATASGTAADAVVEVVKGWVFRAV